MTREVGFSDHLICSHYIPFMADPSVFSHLAIVTCYTILELHQGPRSITNPTSLLPNPPSGNAYSLSREASFSRANPQHATMLDHVNTSLL